MPVLDVRDIMSWPAGDNATDTVFGNVHFNLTLLEHWNYTLYSNNTLSNGTKCILTFGPYPPTLLYPNGTFINSTSCYSAIDPVGIRGGVGIAFAVLYAISLVFICINLTKHGKRYLPATKRFYPLGRRWQWYWGLFVCGAAVIGLFTGVDVDRFYLPEIPIVLNNFFWYLMQLGAMALVWEAVRHWGSWMERQFIDPNPFVLQQSDKRGMFEFWLPLFFYFWLWINFFLVIPRNWGNIEKQRDFDQTRLIAEPSATDIRFKIATFCLLICWLTIMTSMWHSIRHYEPRNRGLFNRAIGFLGYMPFRFVLLLPLALAVVAYQGLCAWEFWLSPQKVDTNVIAMYVGGYLPTFLILWVQIISGFLRPNEDKNLIQQRRQRGDAIDRDLGIVKKPAWWRRVNGDMPVEGMRDRLMRNVREVGGGAATARNVELAAETRARESDQAQAAAERERAAGAAPIEMNEIRRANSIASSMRTSTAPPPYEPPYSGKSATRRNERAMQAAAGLLFPNAAPPPPRFPQDDEGAAGRGRVREGESGAAGGLHVPRPGTSERSNSTASGNTINAPPQQIKSMLDV
ncbi:hypothetical protein PG993_009347 [Apiospora rasikravindrae]|uniref:Uncharacterized protein n=1 Tax=Apiospora rasikravindrae TaxID=990691 RepID=A0ABR1SJ43_9PEZI